MTHNEKPLLVTPSWVIPGTYAENLRFLEDKKEIAGVELLFFIYDDETRAQLDSEWNEICRYKERFIFTAHLPEKLLGEHEELVARLAPLVRHFIVHPPRENPAALARLLKEWGKRYGALFLAENITPGLLEALLPHLGEDELLCMDTGHLLLDGKNPANFFNTYGKRIGEIHLHGLDREQAARDGRLPDHRRLRGDEAWLLELLPPLKDYRGIINLEVFSWEEVRTGIEVLRNMSLLNGGYYGKHQDRDGRSLEQPDQAPGQSG
jgi:sugar phosphate isomerase/epimerase